MGSTTHALSFGGLDRAYGWDQLAEGAKFVVAYPDANRVYATGCGTPHPTSVMHIHGTADRLIRYDGHEWPPFATGALWQFFAARPRPSA